MEYDPSVPAPEDPYESYRELRDHHPAYYHAPSDSWTLSRYADVAAALQDPATYSSAHGIGVGQPEGVAGAFPTIIMMDPPRHTQMRSLVNKAFTPRRIGQMQPRIDRLAHELVDAFDGPSVDLVHDFANPLPTIVIANLLGQGQRVNRIATRRLRFTQG